MAAIKTTVYSKFKGVDFSTDPSLVESCRSPYAPNLVADLGGMPEKRVGWRVLHTLEAPINGIFEGTLDGTHYFVIHAGTKLYSWDGANAPVLIRQNVNNAKSTGFFFNVMTDVDREIARINGNKANDLNNDATTNLIKGTDFIFILTGREILYFGKKKTLTAVATHSASVDYTYLAGGKIFTQTCTSTSNAYTEALTCGNVSDIAHIPLTKSLGTPYEKINLVQTKRKITVTPGTADNTQTIDISIKDLDGTDFSADGTIEVKFVFSSHTVHLAEVPSSLRAWLAPNIFPVLWCNFSADRKKGVVYIKTPAGEGVFGSGFFDTGEYAKGYTVEVIFTKNVVGYADRINKCTVNTIYGYNSSDRVFFTGNPDYPNYDWYSNYKDPTYIEDLSYATVGAISSAIVGYARYGKYLAILKADTGEDSTMYLRYGEVDSGGRITFPTFQSVVGTGAISAKAIGTLLDEPLFLSNTGIYAIVSNNLTNERTIQNRSYFVDSVLTKEANLQNAISTTWNGYFIVCVNGHCYLLDGKQDKTYKDKSGSNYVYECYYWTNIPAVCFCNYKEGARENIYFGTTDGKLCRFNDDIATLERFNDNKAAIACAWATLADDDGDITLNKSMLKKGGCVTIKPYQNSSAKVFFRTEKEAQARLVCDEKADIYSWVNLDFQRLTFNSSNSPQEIFFNSKIKNYRSLQIIIANENLNEGFGIYNITKHYVVGGFGK